MYVKITALPYSYYSPPPVPKALSLVFSCICCQTGKHCQPHLQVALIFRWHSPHIPGWPDCCRSDGCWCLPLGRKVKWTIYFAPHCLLFEVSMKEGNPEMSLIYSTWTNSCQWALSYDNGANWVVFQVRTQPFFWGKKKIQDVFLYQFFFLPISNLPSLLFVVLH